MHGLSLFLFSTLPPQNILNTKPSSLDIFGLRYLNINIEDFQGGREEGSSNLRSFFEKCEPINPADKVLASWEFVWKCKQETSCVQAGEEVRLMLCCVATAGVVGVFSCVCLISRIVSHGRWVTVWWCQSCRCLKYVNKNTRPATMTVQWKTLMDKQSKM